MTKTAAAPATAPTAVPAAKTAPKKVKAAKKSTGPKKPSTKPTHPSTGEMVNAAIDALKEKKGSSLVAIKKYIAAHYKVDVDKRSTFIKKYIKSAVAKKTIVQTKGSGARGSFKLAAKAEGEKKVPKKPAVAKKPAAAKKSKAAAKPKEDVAKKSAAAKEPAAKKPAAAKKSTAEPKPFIDRPMWSGCGTYRYRNKKYYSPEAKARQARKAARKAKLAKAALKK